LKKKYLDKLKNADIRLYNIITNADRDIKMKVFSTHRTPEEQFELFKKGREQNKKGEWIVTGKVVTYKDGYIKQSKHNRFPSLAVDVVPEDQEFPDGKFDWNNIEIFKKMCYKIKKHSKLLGIEIRQGRDWQDYPHQELL